MIHNFYCALFYALLVLVPQAFIGSGTLLAEDDRPNIVYILLDDLGYGDLQEDIMPNCSELASRGTKMQLYSHQTCLATRTALFTGMYPRRFNLQSTWPTPINPGVPTTQKILSEHLSDAGYTCGMFGKWHLGWQDKSQWPTRRGFDEFVGFLGGHISSYGSQQSGIPYADGTLGHDHHGFHDFQFNEIPFRSPTYSTDLFADFSKAFIRKQKDAENPFFLYVPFNAPHGPYAAPRDQVVRAALSGDFPTPYMNRMETYEGDVLAAPEDNSVSQFLTSKILYRAMVYAVDDAIGEIYEELEANGLAENTIFVVSSDNGVGYTYDTRGRYRTFTTVGSSGPLRGHKGSTYEGGTRVANLIVWPGMIEPEQKIDSNIWIGDLMATFLDLGNVTTPEELDGTTIVPAVTDNELLSRPYGGQKIMPVTYRTATRAAATIVFKQRKYIRTFQLDEDDNIVPDSAKEELYDLRNDIGETENLVGSASPAYVHWLDVARLNFEAVGGDQMLIDLEYRQPGSVWQDFVFTPEFGFPFEAEVLETTLH